MTAYSFKRQFIAPIQAGTKTQTIRAQGLRRHVQPGEAMQIYFGMRTKQCRKIVEDVICRALEAIEIDVENWHVSIGGVTCGEVARAGLARNDGFASEAEMRAFWLEEHGPGVFSGVIIYWK